MSDLRIVQVRDRETGRWTNEKTVDASEARDRVKYLKSQGYAARSVAKAIVDYAKSLPEIK